MSKPLIFDDWPESLQTPWGPYRFVIAEHYDGDTPRGWVSLGLDEYAWAEIRMADVHAPEIRSTNLEEKRQGQFARAHLEYLLPIGSKVRVRTEKLEGADEVASFTRYVGWITRADGLDVNKAMSEWLAEKGYHRGS